MVEYGPTQHDDSFPVALDANLQRIRAEDALKLQKYVSNPVFYCPKCYKIDPDHKTKVHPSNHHPPRFNRNHHEEHVTTCQYKSDFFHNITRKIGIEMNGQVIRLSLMPYDGRDMQHKLLATKRKRYVTEDHKRFMTLIRSMLMDDYEWDVFEKKYTKYRLLFENGASKSITRLVKSLDHLKANFQPYQEKLHLIVGRIEEVRCEDEYISLKLTNSSSPDMFYLYVDRFFCDLDQLISLKDQRICCMGYVTKQGESDRGKIYVLEVFSISHQMVFLDQKIDIESRIQTKKLVSFLESLTQAAKPVASEDFHHSYYEKEFKKLEDAICTRRNQLVENVTQRENKQQQIQEQINQYRFQINEAKNHIKPIHQAQIRMIEEQGSLDQQIEDIQQTIAKLHEEKNNWRNWFKNMFNRKMKAKIVFEIEKQQNQLSQYQTTKRTNQQNITDLEQDDSIQQAKRSELEEAIRALEDELSQHSQDQEESENEIERFAKQLKEATIRYEAEKREKEKMALHGELYEIQIHPDGDWSVILDLSMECSAMQVECILRTYLVKKVGMDYLPYSLEDDTQTWFYQRQIDSNRYKNIKRMTCAIEKKLTEDIRRLSQLVHILTNLDD